MTHKHLDWQPDLSLPGSKATVQHIATTGSDRLVIDAAPRGEADLTVNGETIAHIDPAPSPGEVFRSLEAAAEDFEASKQMRRDRAFLDAIEDDEVRESLGVLRARPA